MSQQLKLVLVIVLAVVTALSGVLFLVPLSLPVPATTPRRSIST